MLSGRRTCGFTLIEALVALVVMLAGLAGGAIVLVQTLHQERESAWRRAAVRHAASLADELRALRGHVPSPAAGEAPAIAAWTVEVLASLPEGASAAVIASDESAELRIAISWPAANGRQELSLPVLP